MFDSEDRQMAVSRQLELLVRDFGEELVAEGLGVKKELYQKMLEEADGMLAAMSGGGQDVEAMEDVLKYSGVDHFVRGR